VVGATAWPHPVVGPSGEIWPRAGAEVVGAVAIPSCVVAGYQGHQWSPSSSPSATSASGESSCAQAKVRRGSSDKGAATMCCPYGAAAVASPVPGGRGSSDKGAATMRCPYGAAAVASPVPGGRGSSDKGAATMRCPYGAAAVASPVPDGRGFSDKGAATMRFPDGAAAVASPARLLELVRLHKEPHDVFKEPAFEEAVLLTAAKVTYID